MIYIAENQIILKSYLIFVYRDFNEFLNETTVFIVENDILLYYFKAVL